MVKVYKVINFITDLIGKTSKPMQHPKVDSSAQ